MIVSYLEIGVATLALGLGAWLLAKVGLGLVARSRASEPRAVSDDAAREILATMADGLIVCDPTGKIEIVNEALCSIAGLSRGDLIGTPLEMLFRGSGEETFSGARWKERIVHEELALLYPAAGEAVDVSVSISQLKGEDGTLQGAVALVRDIRESRRAQARLAESETRLAEAQRLARCGHWRWAAKSEAVTGSVEFCRIFELSPGEAVPSRRVLRRLARRDRRALLRSVRGALQEGEGAFQHEVRLTVAGGEERFLHIRGETVAGRDGEAPVLAGTAQDVTEQREAAETMRALGKAFETTQVGITIADLEGTILYVNPAEADLHGYRVEELIGANVDVLAPAELRQRLGPDELREVRRRRRETVNLHREGRQFPVELTSDVLTDTAGEPIGVVTSCLDITERQKLEQELVKHAFYDVLTGLPNRTLLMDQLRLATRRARDEGRSFALLCVGLDRFDTVISSLGPEAGDFLLTACAERLKAHALACDTVARIGGDDFVVLVDRLSGIADATRLADRILNQLGREIEIGGREVFVGACVGVVLAGAKYERSEDVLRDAETAMHRARSRRGPGRYEVFDEGMHEEALRRLELETELRQALEREELILEYQPIVSVPTGRVQGAEALLRWRHPRHGVLAPAALLPLAEETDLIFEIGEWALETACRQNLAWQKAGLEPLFVAVNLSASQFRQRELPAQVRDVLRVTGLDPTRLELELTETVLMEDTNLAVDALDALAATGVGLCVDDFGVGHSSLSYLQRFPMSTLKIDRSFIRDVGNQERADSMTSSIIGLAHNLGLKAIAEGVESERQLAALKSQTCDEFQGYYFSPSVSGEDFAALVTG